MSQVMKADDPTEAWMDWFFQPESVAQDDWCADDIVVEHGNDWRGQEGRPGSSTDPQPFTCLAGTVGWRCQFLIYRMTVVVRMIVHELI